MTPRPTVRPRSLLLALVTALLLLSGCSGTDASSTRGEGGELVAEHGLAGLDAREVVERLDAMPVADRPSDLMASVRPDVLVLSDLGGREVELAMPKDEVYVSVAPYRAHTHDCHFHSLTTCEGELSDQPVTVRLTGPDGEVLVDETRRTFDNGFVGLWVPRGIEATLTLEHEGRTATAAVSTRRDDDATCITTMHLT